MPFEVAISTPEFDAHRQHPALVPSGNQSSGSTVAGMTRADHDRAGAAGIEEWRL
ncbi:MAG TPA: hypothetical protein VN897_01530 [Mycobacterium sp.]|nr:hypothetical protein [Mycobacterium sp.]